MTSELETHIVSVERIKEYTEVKQEVIIFMFLVQATIKKKRFQITSCIYSRFFLSLVFDLIWTFFADIFFAL